MAATRQQYGTQRATVQQLEATVQSDQAQIDAAKLNVAYCSITSPIDGTAGLRLVDVGNLVQTSAATPLVVVTQIKPIYVTFTVPERDLDRSRQAMAGQPLAVLAFNGDDNNQLSDGTIKLVNNQVDQSTGTVTLKRPNSPTRTEAEIIQRLWPKLAQVPGITTYLQPLETIQIGGRLSRTQYQYTLQDVDIAELQEWAPKLEAKLKNLPALQDVASDLEHTSPQLIIRINRDLASRLGINPSAIESTLYDAFGQRYVTQIYAPLNTYRVVMEVAPAYQEDVSALSRLYDHGSGGLVPFSQFAELVPTTTTVSVNH